MVNIKNVNVHGLDTLVRIYEARCGKSYQSDSYYTHVEDDHTLVEAKLDFFVGDQDLKNILSNIRAIRAQGAVLESLSVVHVQFDCSSEKSQFGDKYDEFEQRAFAQAISRANEQVRARSNHIMLTTPEYDHYECTYYGLAKMYRDSVDRGDYASVCALMQIINKLPYKELIVNDIE